MTTTLFSSTATHIPRLNFVLHQESTKSPTELKRISFSVAKKQNILFQRIVKVADSDRLGQIHCSKALDGHLDHISRSFGSPMVTIRTAPVQYRFPVIPRLVPPDITKSSFSIESPFLRTSKPDISPAHHPLSTNYGHICSSRILDELTCKIIFSRSKTIQNQTQTRFVQPPNPYNAVRLQEVDMTFPCKKWNLISSSWSFPILEDRVWDL